MSGELHPRRGEKPRQSSFIGADRADNQRDPSQQPNRHAGGEHNRQVEPLLGAHRKLHMIAAGRRAANALIRAVIGPRDTGHRSRRMPRKHASRPRSDRGLSLAGPWAYAPHLHPHSVGLTPLSPTTKRRLPAPTAAPPAIRTSSRLRRPVARRSPAVNRWPYRGKWRQAQSPPSGSIQSLAGTAVTSRPGPRPLEAFGAEATGSRSGAFISLPPWPGVDAESVSPARSGLSRLAFRGHPRL